MAKLNIQEIRARQARDIQAVYGLENVELAQLINGDFIWVLVQED